MPFRTDASHENGHGSVRRTRGGRPTRARHVLCSFISRTRSLQGAMCMDSAPRSRRREWLCILGGAPLRKFAVSSLLLLQPSTPRHRPPFSRAEQERCAIHPSIPIDSRSIYRALTFHGSVRGRRKTRLHAASAPSALCRMGEGGPAPSLSLALAARVMERQRQRAQSAMRCSASSTRRLHSRARWQLPPPQCTPCFLPCTVHIGDPVATRKGPIIHPIPDHRRTEYDDDVDDDSYI